MCKTYLFCRSLLTGVKCVTVLLKPCKALFVRWSEAPKQERTKSFSLVACADGQCTFKLHWSKNFRKRNNSISYDPLQYFACHSDAEGVFVSVLDLKGHGFGNINWMNTFQNLVSLKLGLYRNECDFFIFRSVVKRILVSLNSCLKKVRHTF